MSDHEFESARRRCPLNVGEPVCGDRRGACRPRPLWPTRRPARRSSRAPPAPAFDERGCRRQCPPVPPGPVRVGARGPGNGRRPEDARVRGRLRDADRHVRFPGGARRRPEHGADARGSRSPDRQQAGLRARRAASRRHRHALLPAEPGEDVRQAGDREGRRHRPHRRRPRLRQRHPAARRLRARGVPQPRRLGPAGRAAGLLLRHGRPPQQQLGQPPLGPRAEEIHRRQGEGPLVAASGRHGFSSVRSRRLVHRADRRRRAPAGAQGTRARADGELLAFTDADALRALEVDH